MSEQKKLHESPEGNVMLGLRDYARRCFFVPEQSAQTKHVENDFSVNAEEINFADTNNPGVNLSA